MVHSNCTSLKDHFNDENDASDILVFCHTLNSFNPNVTSAENFFNGFCCLNASLTKLCVDFIKSYVNNPINLKCPKSFDFREYSLYTYLLLSICLPLGLVANSLILYAVLRHRSLPRPTGYFLCSLAIGDIGVILMFICYVVYNHCSKSTPGRVYLFLIPSFNIFFAAVSLLQISTISVERAIAVSLPLSYSKYITSYRARCSTLFVWAISVAHFVLSVMRINLKSKTYENFFIILCKVTLLFVPMTVVLFCYVLVLYNAYQQLKQEKKRLKTLSSVMCPRINENKNMHKKIYKNLRQNRFKELKISLNIAVIVLPFLCCWGFFTFVHVFEAGNIKIEGVANWFINTLPFIVSSTNPIVYLVLTRSLRETVKSLLILKISKWFNYQESERITSTMTSMMTKEYDENNL
ncbi:cannabinoid receptor 1 [Hydra vulgaris]|uniref:cannabinoid receptor 1 n=1 Tax=Hydra vulgaris TaxID=6087 RepID=UPI000640EC4B|nr:cannabinoid receptor 1 [Hydra vulgaris]